MQIEVSIYKYHEDWEPTSEYSFRPCFWLTGELIGREQDFKYYLFDLFPAIVHDS